MEVEMKNNYSTFYGNHSFLAVFAGDKTFTLEMSPWKTAETEEDLFLISCPLRSHFITS